MGKETSARKAQTVSEEIRQFAEQWRQKVYAGQGYPDWGTLFAEIEELGMQIGEEPEEERTAEPLSEEDRASRSSPWRESKIGCLATLSSPVHEADPSPEIPRHFLDPPRILKLSREATEERTPSPEVLVKSVVATKPP